MAEILRFSTLDHPEYLDIKGEYRLQLEQYLKEWIMKNDTSIKTCRVIFYSQIENDIPVYTISCTPYCNIDGRKLLEVFEEYVKNNTIHTCTYCEEIISSKNYKFCGNYICSVCEKTAKTVLLQNRMKKDLEEWENR